MSVNTVLVVMLWVIMALQWVAIGCVAVHTWHEYITN